MKVPFHGETEAASNFLDLGEMDPAELRMSKTKVTQGENSVRLIGVTLYKQPSCACVRREELGNRHWILVVSQSVDQEPNAVFDREQINVSHGV